MSAPFFFSGHIGRLSRVLNTLACLMPSSDTHPFMNGRRPRASKTMISGTMEWHARHSIEVSSTRIRKPRIPQHGHGGGFRVSLPMLAIPQGGYLQTQQAFLSRPADFPPSLPVFFWGYWLEVRRAASTGGEATALPTERLHLLHSWPAVRKRPESNRRPRGCQPRALSTELRPTLPRRGWPCHSPLDSPGFGPRDRQGVGGARSKPLGRSRSPLPFLLWLSALAKTGTRPCRSRGGPPDRPRTSSPGGPYATILTHSHCEGQSPSHVHTIGPAAQARFQAGRCGPSRRDGVSTPIP